MDEDPVSFAEDDIRIQLQQQAEELQMVDVVTKEAAVRYINLIKTLIAAKNSK